MKKLVFSSFCLALSAIVLLSGCGGGSNTSAPTPTIYVGTESGLAISTDGGQTFQNRTTAEGLPSNMINRVFVTGSTIYVATTGGLAVSTDGLNFTPVAALGGATITDVYAEGSTIYVGTIGGLAISHDGGSTFHTYDVTNTSTSGPLYCNYVNGLTVTDTKIYAATNEGLSVIDINDPTSFVAYTAGDGLGDNTIQDVRVANGKIYAGTLEGLSISATSPVAFTNHHPANFIRLHVVGSMVYAATEAGIVIGDVSGSSPSFTTYTNAANGLANDSTWDIYVFNNTIYTATDGGLAISSDGGSHFATVDTVNGLGSEYVRCVFVK